MINVIIADDHKIVVDGLVSILENEKDIQVVGTALNGNKVLELIENKSIKIDIAILDIEMPEKNGVELSEIINHKYKDIKVLILSMYKTRDFVNSIINTGAMGYILKNRGSEELVRAIHYVNKGQKYLGQEITDILVEAYREKTRKKQEPKYKLTRREKEVLALIAKGKTSNEIGKELYIAPSTVDTHRRNLIEKIGVASSKELIIFALNNKDSI